MKGLKAEGSGLGWSGLARLKADGAVRQVAERTGLRLPAPAEHERAAIDRIFLAVPIDDRDVVSLDALRPVLADPDDSRHLAHLLHRGEELAVAVGLLKLVEQQLHRFNG